MTNERHQIEDVSGPLDAIRFLELSGDEELLAFLRKLPMVTGHEDGRLSMSDLIFEMRLWPFVKRAWREVEGGPGIPGRLRQLSSVYKKAEAEFERETGIQRRRKRVIDLPTFLNIYSLEGLP